MVTASVNQSAQGIEDALLDRDLVGIAAFGTLVAGGLFLAQEVTDQVMPMLGQSADPTSPSGLGINALLKVLGAFLTVTAGFRVGGMTAQAVTGMLAIGMVASAGLDVVDVLQRGGAPGNSPFTSSPSSSSSSGGSPTVTRSSSGSPTVTRSGSSPSRASAGSGFR